MMEPRTTVENPDYALDLTASYDHVNEFVTAVFGGKQAPVLTRLSGGITNLLLKGSIGDVQFLIRAYGKGTSSIINRDREYATHQQLYSLGLAPPLYARFANGLIYGYVAGESIHYTQMSDPAIMKGVASRLGQWHTLLDAKKIEQSMKKSDARDLWQLLRNWIEIMPETTNGVSRQELRDELRWIQSKIDKVGPKVVAHCDLLSGNIITDTSGSVSFIDYEYSTLAARGFDLANHFVEFQGFDCRLDLIPKPELDNPVMRYFCSHYLTSVEKYSTTNNQVEAKDVDSLIKEVKSWWGVPGLYWAVWAAIQSSISEIDFDYASYSKSRIAEYYDWKSRIYPRL